MSKKILGFRGLSACGIIIGLTAFTVRADSSASGSINLNSLSVTPSSGNITWSGWTLNALSTSLNSSGEFSQNYDFGESNPGAASAASSVTYASGSAAATASSLDASSISGHASGSITIPGNINESASVSGGYGNFSSLENSFTLSQDSLVAFNLIAAATQSLKTDVGGQVLEDEVILNLNVNGSPVLTYDNALTLGSNSQLDTGTVTPSLSSSVPLTAGTYDLYLEMDHEAGVVEAAPEPSDIAAMGMLALGAGVCLGGRRLARQ